MYDVSFAKLSERFFKTTSWPPVHMIADLVDGDHVFCLLYKVQLQRFFALCKCVRLWTTVCTALPCQHMHTSKNTQPSSLQQ